MSFPVRNPELPFIPGYTFNNEIHRTQFRRSQQFHLEGDIRMLDTKMTSTQPGKIHERYPSIYSRGDVAELPAWIAFNKEALTFDAFFQETLQEMRNAPFQIRKCKIYFYLEDGSIKVYEPKISNSGTDQGLVIRRQRIRMAPPKDAFFYDIVDFNVGNEIDLFGKVMKITNCDQFTRTFLNRLGIQVPDPIDTPEDPYHVEREKAMHTIFSKHPNRNKDTFGQFLKYDRCILRFYAFWDDRHREGGTIHELVIYYFMVDDTVQITETVTENCGADMTFMFMRRGKLPKFFDELPTPGYFDRTTVLNVLGTNLQDYRYTLDPLNCGKNNVEYYSYNDFSIGAAINVYGRKVVITDFDPFTKKFYQEKFGIHDFSPYETPKEHKVVVSVPVSQRKLPPWNGYGSFEDSAQNCRTVELRSLITDIKQFLKLDRDGMDSRILRFKAVLRSKNKNDYCRRFVISYYLCDNTISVFEVTDEIRSCFMKRQQMKISGQEIFTSEPPDYYEPHHMFIGATLNLQEFVFLLIDADEYALRYMEINAEQFPKANIKLIMEKIKSKLKPIYKDFVAENLPSEVPVIEFDKLRDKLCRVMGDDWSEHEMITLARHFSGICKTERYSRTFIRQIVLVELKKKLWDNLDRLKECFKSFDTKKTGYLPKKEVYTLIRACKLPLDVLVIEHMLNVLDKNEQCEINGEDLFCFLDRNFCPVSDVIPINVKTDLWFASEPEPIAGRLIDWCAFNKALNLEEEFK